MFFTPEKSFDRFKNRRNRIVNEIKSKRSELKKSALLVIADFETARYLFRQESSFYYLTGINEPAVVLCSYFDGPEVLYIPFYEETREQWVKTELNQNVSPEKFGVDRIKYLGQQIKGYSVPPFFTFERYNELVEDLKAFVGKGGTVYTLMDSTGVRYFTQMRLVACLQDWLLDEKVIFQDVSDVVHQSRKIKDSYEIDLIYKACQITAAAIQSAAKIVKPGKFEFQVQAVIDYTFKEMASSDPAFPSIVATGKNTTIIHSCERSRQLKSGDLVVIDVGAEYGNYASDLTRTFPVSGGFTARQREVYEVVLQTQRHIESLAVPGMFLNNETQPEKSLYHQALEFLRSHGYAQYFVHGIGHYLGLDVHDVGSYKIPLQPGDVFTIEPGIYIPQENIGIRIEDDYVITDDGVTCLSEGLVKMPSMIEDLLSGQ